MKYSRNIRFCRSCGSDKLVGILNLGRQVPANNLKDAYATAVGVVDAAPLRLLFCEECKLVQLAYTVDPKILFDEYLYVSSTSPVFKAHFEELAETINKRFSPSTVLDIGSNDGVLLDPLKKLGIESSGIDPANNFDRPDTFKEYFDDREVRYIFKGKKFDVITACNVFAHIADVHSVIENVKCLLAGEGTFIIEVAYLGSMIENKYFDMIYHEHLFYYSLQSMINLLMPHGLYVNDVELVPTHGGSIRIYASRRFRVSDQARGFLTLEYCKGINYYDTYKKFSKDIEAAKTQNMTLLGKLRRDGYKIIGYGAPAKATVLISYFGIDSYYFSNIIDDNPLKTGKCIPETSIEIIKYPENLDVDYIYILAWNFAESIMAKCKEKGYKGKFIVPLPEPKIYE